MFPRNSCPQDSCPRKFPQTIAPIGPSPPPFGHLPAPGQLPLGQLPHRKEWLVSVRVGVVREGIVQKRGIVLGQFPYGAIVQRGVVFSGSIVLKGPVVMMPIARGGIVLESF